MARSKKENREYIALKNDIRDSSLKNLYLFYGEERYLLEYYLGEIRKIILSDGLSEFNYKKLDGKSLSISQLREAVDSPPFFSERTLVEVDDFDIFRSTEDIKKELIDIFSDLPEYVCLIFVYDTVEYKPDGRVKINSELKKHIEAVEFEGQEQNDLINWIGRRFKALDKQIDRATADYLIFVSGGLMTKLVTEIEKVAAYSQKRDITREDIDAVVIPVIDAVTYKLTNAIIDRRFDSAVAILSDLLAMREPPHRIIYSVSLKIRQLYSAWICLDCGKGMSDLMDMFDIRNDFQARGLMTGARKAGEKWCKDALKMCTETAAKLNSSSVDNEELLSQLIVNLAVIE